jgi:hypothetical protein
MHPPPVKQRPFTDAAKFELSFVGELAEWSQPNRAETFQPRFSRQRPQPDHMRRVASAR